MPIRDVVEAGQDMEAFKKEQTELLKRDRAFWLNLMLKPVTPQERKSLEVLMKSLVLEQLPFGPLPFGDDMLEQYGYKIEGYRRHYPDAQFEAFNLRRKDGPYVVILERLGERQCAGFMGGEFNDELVRENVVFGLAARVAAKTGFKPTAYLMGKPYRANNGVTIAHLQLYHNEIVSLPNSRIV